MQKIRINRCWWVGLPFVCITLCHARPLSAADQSAGPPASTWKAGVAKVAITPEKKVWLAGYGAKRVPDAKRHELWAKAIALEAAPGERCVLITSDFQGVPRGMSDEVFSRVQKKFGLERKGVMFTFSHNHCGPRLGEDLIDYYPVEEEQERLVAEYTQLMIEKMVELVGTALSRLEPVTIRQGAGKATFAVNRRNNREAEVPALLAAGTALKGPVDHTVPVLTITRLGKTGTGEQPLLAILFGYACHPTVLNDTAWCGDYPGYAQIEIERAHPGALALFVNTCGGDQNPLPRRTVALCEKYGHLLATGVEEGLQAPMRQVSPGWQGAFEYVTLPYLHTLSRAELEFVQRNERGARLRWATRMLKKLDRGEQFAQSYPYPVHAWKLGQELLFIGMGAETVVDYALRFKTEFGPGTWVLGYADDMISYIPSRRVWEEGGYEGGFSLFEYGRPAYRWDGSIENRIASTVQDLVKHVQWRRPATSPK